MITTKARAKIAEWSKNYDSTSMFVSFSGGKDSTVVYSLVREALGSDRIRHFFGNTTLEFATTESYANRFRNDSVKAVFFRTSMNRTKNFEEMCPIYGPPSFGNPVMILKVRIGSIDVRVTIKDKVKSIVRLQSTRCVLRVELVKVYVRWKLLKSPRMQMVKYSIRLMKGNAFIVENV